MPGKDFEASVRYQESVAVIDLRGEVNAFADEAINAAYAEAVSGDSATVLLNFDAVDYINSTGIALIVGLLAMARKAHRRVLACGLSDHYREVFQITRLADFMSIFPDEVSAFANAPASADS